MIEEILRRLFGLEKRIALLETRESPVVPRCRLRHSTTQAVSTASATPIAFNTEDIDTDTMHDTVTNNTRITFKAAGDYVVMASAEFAPNATGQRQISIKLNNTTYIALDNTPTVGAGDSTRIPCGCLYTFAVNDYVEALAYQDSGGNLNVNGNTYGTLFHAFRVG
jgi:hypothetical protein